MFLRHGPTLWVNRARIGFVHHPKGDACLFIKDLNGYGIGAFPNNKGFLEQVTADFLPFSLPKSRTIPLDRDPETYRLNYQTEEWVDRAWLHPTLLGGVQIIQGDLRFQFFNDWHRVIVKPEDLRRFDLDLSEAISYLGS